MGWSKGSKKGQTSFMDVPLSNIHEEPTNIWSLEYRNFVSTIGAIHKLSRLGRGRGLPKDDLLKRPYLIKKTTRGRVEGTYQKLPLLRRHSLWTTLYIKCG